MENNVIEAQEQFRTKCLTEAGLTYSVSAVLPILLTTFISVVLAFVSILFADASVESADWFLYLTYFMPQLAFAGAAAIYFLRSKEPVKKTYAACNWRFFLLAVLLQFGLLFSLSALNGYFIELLRLVGYEEAGVPMPSLEGWNLLPAILVIALLPAICEETIFRGILSRSMHARGWGLVPTVIIAGAMFSLFHGNPEQTIYQFICGMCFTLVAIRAGSILPTIVAHFLNNAIILILTAFGFGDLSVLPQGGYLALLAVSAVCLVGSLVWLIFFEKQGNQKGGVKDGKRFFLAAAVGLAVCAVEWIYVLVTRL